jgi:hypothetical protein
LRAESEIYVKDKRTGIRYIKMAIKDATVINIIWFLKRKKGLARYL